MSKTDHAVKAMLNAYSERFRHIKDEMFPEETELFHRFIEGTISIMASTTMPAMKKGRSAKYMAPK